MTQNQAQVLIVGSGPSGLLLALCLLKNGVPVRIIEKDVQHHPMERGAGIWPRTLEIEHFLGVLSDIQKIGIPTPTIYFFEPEDPRRVVQSFSMAEKVDPSPAFPITRGLMLGQYRHQAVLREHIERLGGTVELGTTLIGFSQDSESVTAEVVKKADGKETKEMVKVKYLIGADGGRSTVRKGMNVDFVGNTDKDAKLYHVDAIMEGLNSNSETIRGDFNIFGKEGGPMIAIRGTGIANKVQIIFFNPSPELVKSGTLDTIQSELTKITGRHELTLKEIRSQMPWRANLRIASHFNIGNVFIIGDAAHTHSPTGGQGLNSSVQDAFNLGWKLAYVLKGYSSPSLLTSYEEERIPVIAEMLQITTSLYRRTFFTDKTNQHAMSEQNPKSKGMQFFREKKLFQLYVNYRWSPIVYDERYPDSGKSMEYNAYGTEGQELRAGDRAPDAPGLQQLAPSGNLDEKSSRLFDLFKPTMHTVLLYVTTADLSKAYSLIEPLCRINNGIMQTIAIVSRRTHDPIPSCDFADFIFKDVDGHAFNGYGLDETATEPVVVTVRPDSMIGTFATSSAGVEKYVNAIFV